MDKVALVAGNLLFFIGVIGFFMTGAEHPTALIPTFFGIVLETLGVLTLINPKNRKHYMHAAAAVALLGALGTAAGVVAAIRWGLGTAPAQPAAVISKTAMFVVCVGFVVLAVRSFKAARAARLSQTP